MNFNYQIVKNPWVNNGELTVLSHAARPVAELANKLVASALVRLKMVPAGSPMVSHGQ